MGAPSLPHQVQCCPGQDLKELVRSRLPSHRPVAVALRAARWQAPTRTPHGPAEWLCTEAPSSQPLTLGCRPRPALILSPVAPRCLFPLNCTLQQRHLPPLGFHFSRPGIRLLTMLTSVYGLPVLSGFQHTLLTRLNLSFRGRNSASRWLGDLPKVTQQARLTKTKIGASPRGVGGPSEPPPGCPPCLQERSGPLGLHGQCPFLPGPCCPLTCCPVFCFCLDLPVQILKPATFTDTAHYPLLLVV